MYNGRKKDKEPLLYLPMFHACQRSVVCVPTCNPIASYHSPAVERSSTVSQSQHAYNGFWGESTSIAVCVRLLNCF